MQIMVALLLLLALFTITTAENEYRLLNLVLPQNLMEAITAIHNDKLYVFGGRNSTQAAGGIKKLFNKKFYRINLKNKFQLKSNNTDMGSSLVYADWEELNVQPPTYGDSKDLNEFVCEGQCSVLIGNYLYIVAPYSSNSSGGFAAKPNVVYRLDLSQDPPVFASETDFKSTTGYVIPANRQCVTAANNIMYTTNGWITGVTTMSTETVSYNPATNTQTNLPNMTATSYKPGRRTAGCAPNVGQTDIYLFGGKPVDNKIVTGASGIDIYDIADMTWTENAEKQQWDLSNGDLSKSRNRIKCVTSLYKNTIECPGGFGIYNAGFAAVKNSLIYDIKTKTEEQVALFQAVFSYGLENYEFYRSADGTVAASVMLVIGGATTDGTEASAIIQYAVRYAQLTNAPTATPVADPTQDTTMPTAAPSRSPLCPTCSFAPTGVPSASPVAVSGGTDGVQQINGYLSMVVVMVVIIFMYR